MLLYCSFTVFFLALVSLFYNWKRNQNSLYLSAFLVCVSMLGITHFLAITGNPLSLLKIFYNNFSPIYFLPGPFLFFYVRGVIDNKGKMTRYDVMHFIPAFIVLINVIPYWFTSDGFKLKVVQNLTVLHHPLDAFNINWLLPGEVSLIGRGILLTIYTILSFYIVNRKMNKGVTINNETLRPGISTRLKILLSVVLLLGIGTSVVAFNFYRPFVNFPKEISILNTGFNYFAFLPLLIIPVVLVCFPEILYGNQIQLINNSNSLVKKSETDSKKKNNLLIHDTEDKNSTEPVSAAIFQRLTEKINEYIHLQKPYLNKDFSMDTLARDLNVPRHHIYHCFSNHMDLKFTDLKKNLRVEYAKNLLKDGLHEQLSIEGIGLQSGFSSKSTFFTVFKSETGMTPTAYAGFHKQLNRM